MLFFDNCFFLVGAFIFWFIFLSFLFFVLFYQLVSLFFCFCVLVFVYVGCLGFCSPFFFGGWMFGVFVYMFSVIIFCLFFLFVCFFVSLFLFHYVFFPKINFLKKHQTLV